MPQSSSSILSVTLFSVKINITIQCLKPGVHCSLNVDDFQICYMSIIESQLQVCLNELQQWATTVLDSLRQRQSVCISARKEVSI